MVIECYFPPIIIKQSAFQKVKQFTGSITANIAPVRVWLWNGGGRCHWDFVSWMLKSRLFVTNVNDTLRPAAVRTILSGQSSKMKWPQFTGKICSPFS